LATNPVLDKGLEWLSRTLAIMIIMVGPGMLGRFLDGYFGVHFLAPVGLIVGMVLGTTLLLVLARKFAPPARGKPLPPDDEQHDKQEE
jgi:F0F1-type ATP synthase assembly protein I